MSGQMINIDLPVEQVSQLLRGMANVDFFDIPGGLGIGFGEEQAAWVSDAHPDQGTDIAVKDRSGQACWRLYDYLAERTSAYMWLLDDGGMIAAARWAPGQTSGRVRER